VKVELAPAYVWDCDNCGRENFQRAISVRLDPKCEHDAEMIREMSGLEADTEIPEHLFLSMTTRPNRVTCKHCETQFEAVDSGDPEEEEDE